MESLLSTGHLIPTINHSDTLTKRFPATHLHHGTKFVGLHIRPRRFRVSSKKASFLDFQDYVKPRRLFPTRDMKGYGDESLDSIILSLQADGSLSLYKVLLRTSSSYGSGLSDLKAGILLCIIDEHGDSILERIPAILHEDHMKGSKDAVASDHICFQRGSTDKYMFWGPKLGRIQALWISLESGKWRLGGVSLTTVSSCDHQGEESSVDGNTCCSITYSFEVEDVLVGEGTDMAMIELRPSHVTEYSGVDPFSIVDTDVTQAALLSEKRITTEESMKEYGDLKYSLLLYDSMLIFAGTSISSITAGEHTAIAFFTGGIGGFLYLLLLQRSVDGLPAPDSVAINDRSNINNLLGGVKGPLLVLAFAFGVAVLVLNRGTPDAEAALSPREILFGMIGFLACKVSVVLAAFKPISMGLEDSN